MKKLISTILLGVTMTSTLGTMASEAPAKPTVVQVIGALGCDTREYVLWVILSNGAVGVFTEEVYSRDQMDAILKSLSVDPAVVHIRKFNCGVKA